jgi:gliding motility-associated-like protein
MNLEYVVIKDRWGKFVYRSSNINETWDGTAQGKKVLEGVYTYMATLINFIGVKKFYSGNITVLR